MEGAVLIIEDHPLVSKGLCVLAKTCGLASVVAAYAAEAARLVTDEWTAVIADVMLPDGNGLDVLAAGREAHGTWPALVLTGNDSPHVANRAFDLDASYLVKPMEPSRVLKWLRYANDGFEERLARALAAWQAEYALTVAELNVLELAARGNSNEEIARSLGVSVATMKSHVKSLLRKTDDDGLARFGATFDSSCAMSLRTA